MKKGISILIVLIIAVFTCAVVAQESDSKVVKEYVEAHEVLKHQLELVARSSQVHSIEDELLSIVEEFRADEELINYGIYPRTFTLMNEDLFGRIQTMETQLLIIENQRERLLDLTNQVASYRSEITKLNSMADSLRKSITASEASEARLSQMVRDYRESLEKRDELIFDMLDSLMISYEGFSMQNPGQVNSELLQRSISTGESPLELVSNLLDDNIEFTESNTAFASVEEHLRMYALQNHFSNVWGKVGDDMILVYGGSGKTQWDADIQTQLREWKMASARKMWQSIDQYLEFNGIDLTAFDNSDSFFAALDAYLNYGLEQSEAEFLTSESYQDYQKLKEFWSSTFKNEWNELVSEADLLTMAQVAEIDTKLDSWEQIARPIHPALIVIVSMLIVSLSGFILVMVKARASKAY